MTITDKQAMRDRIDARFRSGNSVPVERANITASEWAVLRAALEAAEAAREPALPADERQQFEELIRAGGFDTTMYGNVYVDPSVQRSRAIWLERIAKDYTAPQPSAPSEPNAAWVNAVESYAAAARVIALYLKRFCDEKLPYPEMIADASRKAAAEIERLSAQPSADDAPGSYSAKVATQVYDALLSTIAAIRAAGVLQHRDYDRIGIKANDAILAFQYERDRKLAAPPADARDAGQRIQDEYDARRYRWLRAADCPSAQVIIDLAHDHSILADSEALDQHIDRAMGGDQ